MLAGLAYFRVGIFGDHEATTTQETTSSTAPSAAEQESIDRELDAIDTGAGLEADFQGTDAQIEQL